MPSLHVQYMLNVCVWLGQARVDGDPLLHIIIQGPTLIEAPPYDTQLRGPTAELQALTASGPEWDKSLPT